MKERYKTKILHTRLDREPQTYSNLIYVMSSLLSSIEKKGHGSFVKVKHVWVKGSVLGVVQLEEVLREGRASN